MLLHQVAFVEQINLQLALQKEEENANISMSIDLPRQDD